MGLHVRAGFNAKVQHVDGIRDVRCNSFDATIKRRVSLNYYTLMYNF